MKKHLETSALLKAIPKKIYEITDRKLFFKKIKQYPRSVEKITLFTAFRISCETFY